jgi:hypothetical protein
MVATVLERTTPRNLAAGGFVLAAALAVGTSVPRVSSPILVVGPLCVVAFLALLKLNPIFVSIFLVLPFLPHAPTEMGPTETIFACSTFVLIAYGLMRLINERSVERSWVNAFVVFFIVVLIATLPVSMAAGVELQEWFRGFAPLAAILLYVVFAQHLDNPRRVLYLIAVVALIWDLRVLYVYVTNHTGIGFRTTFALASGHLPISAFGVVAGLSLRNTFGWALTSISLAAALTTAGRGLIVCIAIVSVILLVRSGIAKSHRNILIISVVGVITLIPLKDEVLPTLTYRFTTSYETDLNHRKIEFAQAADALNANPLLGRGLGWGFDARVLGPDFSGIRISYLHNSFSYFAMASGLLGVLAYHGLLIAAVVRWFKRPLRDQLDLAAGGILLIVALYGQFQAMFRLFHTNLFLALALAVILARNGRGLPESHETSDSTAPERLQLAD